MEVAFFFFFKDTKEVPNIYDCDFVTTFLSPSFRWKKLCNLWKKKEKKKYLCIPQLTEKWYITLFFSKQVYKRENMRVNQTPYAQLHSY